ncbi:hypothetical protein P3G22_04085 [Rhodopseudomonas sp. BAL398]|nr:hypothetical protein [Rhodopseudomonas sp. BAL398]
MLASYLPAFFIAGTLCIVRALIILKRQPREMETSRNEPSSPVSRTRCSALRAAAQSRDPAWRIDHSTGAPALQRTTPLAARCTASGARASWFETALRASSP